MNACKDCDSQIEWTLIPRMREHSAPHDTSKNKRNGKVARVTPETAGHDTGGPLSKKQRQYLRLQCRITWARTTDLLPPEPFDAWVKNFEKRLERMRTDYENHDPENT
jgi:hypothetical protein